MAEASPENTSLTNKEYLQLLHSLITDNSLDCVKETLATLSTKQCTRLLNSKIDGCLPLYLAIKFNHIAISRVLLTYSLLQGQSCMNKRWKKGGHPLLAAINVGNLQMIELILLYTSDINENISGPLSPLIVAILLKKLNAVKMIVAMGADINKVFMHGRIPLMYTTSNVEMCSYLLSKGAHVNHQDVDGFTALHLAVGWNHIEAVDLLIMAGADVRIRNQEGYNPLIWSIINENEDMFVNLLHQPAYTASHHIEALEILNSYLVSLQKQNITAWKTALDLRRRRNMPKKCTMPRRDLFDYLEEFTTESELESLKGNPFHLAFHGMLVLERQLGRNHRLYLQCILQTALLQKKNLKKVKQLIYYINKCSPLIISIGANIKLFEKLFSEIAGYTDLKIFFEFGGFTIYKIMAQTALVMWIKLKKNIINYPVFVDGYYPNIVDSFLYMTSVINNMPLSEETFSQFIEILKIVLKADIRVKDLQSILHRAVILSETEKWVSIRLIDVLLKFGADANSTDYLGRTPINYTFDFKDRKIRIDLIDLMIEHGGDMYL